MLYDNKSTHDLSAIYTILCESAGDNIEKLVALAKRIERSYYTDKAKETEFGREAQELGYKSVYDLMREYDLYKRYILNTEPKYTAQNSPSVNPMSKLYKSIKHYGEDTIKQNIEDHENTPHNVGDFRTGAYYITNYRLINSVLNILQQTKYMFTFEDIDGNIFTDMKCLRPYTINNRGKYRFAQFVRKMTPDVQIDNSVEFTPSRIINKDGPDFDINPNEIESIDIHNGNVEITAKVPIDLYCR